MKIDPESWPTLSRLLDQLLDLPEESRPGWLENLAPEHANIAPLLRQLVSAEASLRGGFLNTLPTLDLSANSGAPLRPFQLPWPRVRSSGLIAS